MNHVWQMLAFLFRHISFFLVRFDIDKRTITAFLGKQNKNNSYYTFISTMDKIYEPNDTFPFDKLVLTNPSFMNSGTYFIRYLVNDNPLYIQPPKCVTKQGVIKCGKKTYCDMLFTNENESFIHWIEELENYSQKYIYNNRSKWFESDLEMNDIENSFTPTLKLYKSGKFYIIRTIVPTRLGKCILKIFNENEMDLPIESIQESTNVITIWEIQGIKCSSRSFQIDIEIKQMMVLQPSKLFEKCIIAKQPVHYESVSLDKNGGDLASYTDIISSIQEEHVPVSEQPLILDASDASDHNELDSIQVSEINFDQDNSFKKEVEIIPEEDNIKIEEAEEAKEAEEEAEEAEEEEAEDNEDDENEEHYPVEFINIEDSDPMTSLENMQLVRLAESHRTGTEGPLIQLTTESTFGAHSSLEVVDIDVNMKDALEESEIQLKTRNDVYYDIYMDAKKKAEEARNLAISAYLEAKRIKELYMIQEPTVRGLRPQQLTTVSIEDAHCSLVPCKNLPSDN